MQRAAGAIFVAALFALAGCSAVFGGGGEPTATLTPAAVPTDEPTPTPVAQLAPGVTGNGIENADALAAAHDAALDGRSYTEWTNYTMRYRNGTRYRRANASVRVAGDGRGWLRVAYGYGREHADESRLARSELWLGDERALSALTYTNGTTTYRDATDDLGPREVGVFTRIGGLGLSSTENPLNGTATRVVGNATRNGTERYRVAIEGPPALPSLPGLEARRSRADGGGWTPRSAAAVVERDGLVREYTVSYGASTESGVPVEVSYTVRRTAIGNTTVERPPWYDEATDGANTTTNRTATPN